MPGRAAPAPRAFQGFGVRGPLGADGSRGVPLGRFLQGLGFTCGLIHPAHIWLLVM